MPDFSFEDSLNFSQKAIVGVDEVGRGCLAGPVFAAAVILKRESLELFSEVKDSKKLTAKKRESLSKVIKENSHWAIGQASSKEIDEINILKATFLAMERAVESLKKQLNYEIEAVIVDGNQKPTNLHQNVFTLVKGDDISLSVAAASIIAKVARDNLMEELHKKYEKYNFFSNKGYGSKEHIKAICKNGFCDIHRKTFKVNLEKY